MELAHGLLHVDQTEVDVGFPVEYHRHDQPAGPRNLLDVAYAPNGEQELLHPLAVEAFHFHRRTVAGAERHDDGRRLHIRQQIDRKPVPGKPAHERHGEGDDADCYGATNGEPGERLEQLVLRHTQRCECSCEGFLVPGEARRRGVAGTTQGGVTKSRGQKDPQIRVDLGVTEH